jgi:hypothetical protein
MKSAYFTIHMGKNPPPQIGCRFLFKSTDFTSSTFPIQPDFSQNQPAAITQNTSSPQTLVCTELLMWQGTVKSSPRFTVNERKQKPTHNDSA